MRGEGAQPRLTLYHSPTSVCSAKVRLLLHALELEWQDRRLDLSKGEQFDPAYLKLNAQAVVPTLVDEGRVVTESNLIMLHLLDHYGSGHDELRSPGCDEWLGLSLVFHDVVNTFTQLIVNRGRLLSLPAGNLDERIARIPDPARAAKFASLVRDGFASPHAIRAARRLHDIVAAIDFAASRSPWLNADHYTVADMAMLPFINRLDMLGMSPAWRQKAHLVRWLDNARQSPGFDQAIVHFVSGSAADKFSVAAEKARAEIERALDLV